MSDRDDGLLRGIVVGVIIGGLAALFLAPKSGEELREDVRGRARRAKEDTEDKLNDLRSGISRRANELRSAARDLAGEAKQESEDLIEQAERLTDDLKYAAKNIARTGKAAKDEAVAEIKPLMSEGAGVMRELERVTRRLASSAKDKLRPESSEEA